MIPIGSLFKGIYTRFVIAGCWVHRAPIILQNYHRCVLVLLISFYSSLSSRAIRFNAIKRVHLNLYFTFFRTLGVEAILNNNRFFPSFPQEINF